MKWIKKRMKNNEKQIKKWVIENSHTDHNEFFFLRSHNIYRNFTKRKSTTLVSESHHLHLSHFLLKVHYPKKRVRLCEEILFFSRDTHLKIVKSQEF